MQNLLRSEEVKAALKVVIFSLAYSKSTGVLSL